MSTTFITIGSVQGLFYPLARHRVTLENGERIVRTESRVIDNILDESSLRSCAIDVRRGWGGTYMQYRMRLAYTN